MTTDTRDCPLCIDKMAPAGSHPILGPVYRLCPDCLPCRRCHGAGVYPATTHCLLCLLEVLAEHRLIAELCAGCLGVTAIHRLPAEAKTQT